MSRSYITINLPHVNEQFISSNNDLSYQSTDNIQKIEHVTKFIETILNFPKYDVLCYIQNTIWNKLYKYIGT